MLPPELQAVFDELLATLEGFFDTLVTTAEATITGYLADNVLIGLFYNSFVNFFFD